MKNSKAILLMSGMLLAGAVGGSLIYLVTSRFLSQNDDTCKASGKSISVAIENDSFSEKQIHGQLCDSLTITNRDDKVRNIAFGEHDKHEPYDGVTEKVLQKGQGFTFTFDTTGTFEVHDHLEDKTQAFFTVTN